ncbi:MAG TPA: FHA domain-containing protein, partial [Candidatus Acidoferrales bacterium]|nr:FHA domain-containing protein [Candidatus Acidoferrales bacterium]
MPAQPGAASSPSSETARPRLVSIGTSEPHEYSLDKQSIAIGSHSSNDIVIADASVSRRHATIARKLGIFELADLDSTNGTFINGGRVRKPVALKRGDEIKFGAVRFAFVAAIDPASAPARAARAPSRLRRVIALLTLTFVLGFLGVRYRDLLSQIAASQIARTTSKTPEPAGVTTHSVSVNTKSSSASPPAVPPANAPPWLKRLNYYRALAKLGPVVEDAALSDGDRAHA